MKTPMKTCLRVERPCCRLLDYLDCNGNRSLDNIRKGALNKLFSNDAFNSSRMCFLLRKLDQSGRSRTLVKPETDPALYRINLRATAMRDETIPTPVSKPIEGGQKSSPLTLKKPIQNRHCAKKIKGNPKVKTT
jgi:hypothetical protein